MSYHRHKSREFALQMLFEWDMAQKEPAQVKRFFWRTAHASEDTRKFANHLFDATVKQAPAIDEIVAKLSENWRLERLAPVDRNILRLAIYEMRIDHKDTPPKVAIDEALELAKKFSSEESSLFLNGILDAAYKHITADAAGS
jgi:transcription antitermination protein NusB